MHAGTIRCSGETGLEQQEFCHYNEQFRDMCAPPARLILEGIAITPEGSVNNPDYELCRCGFRQGNRDCIHSKLCVCVCVCVCVWVCGCVGVWVGG